VPVLRALVPRIIIVKESSNDHRGTTDDNTNQHHQQEANFLKLLYHLIHTINQLLAEATDEWAGSAAIFCWGAIEAVGFTLRHSGCCNQVSVDNKQLLSFVNTPDNGAPVSSW
jgi:hypothetical protein